MIDGAKPRALEKLREPRLPIRLRVLDARNPRHLRRTAPPRTPPAARKEILGLPGKKRD
jgi:hypothetical protein